MSGHPRRARWAKRDAYRGHLVHGVVELLQCLDERGDLVHETDRIVDAADCGRDTFGGRSISAHLIEASLYSFESSDCIYCRDVCGVELVGWCSLVYL